MKIVDGLAPTLKLLEIQLEHQITPDIEKNMPVYQIKDAK